jgi:hypothetical protein
MLKDQPEAGPYLTFSDMLTGYRQSAVLMLAHDAGVIEAVGEGCEGPELCARLGWEPVYGGRFLLCLCGLGLLRLQDGRYFLSRFSATYLCSASEEYQGSTLTFEKQLRQSWEQLSATLQTGKRVFAAGDKDPQELERAFFTYLGSMDEAARIRSEELWDWFPVPASSGTIMDIGAGSGTFLYNFLMRYPAWRGIFCDLPEVVADKRLHRQITGLEHRITLCGCNLLSDSPSEFEAIREQSCDVALLSNIVHCQGTPETYTLLRKVASRTGENGVLVVHDFFSDTGWRGSLYDIHMMLNTFNGQTYAQQEIIDMAASFGFHHSLSRQLRSGSTAIVLARNRRTITSFPL